MVIGTKNRYARLSHFLDEQGFLSRDQFKEMSKKARNERRGLIEMLLSEGILSKQDEAIELIAELLGYPTVSLKKRVIAKQVINLIPKEIAERHSVIIFKKIKDVIQVATTAPEDTQVIEFIKKKTGLTPHVFLTAPQDLKYALQKYDSELSEEFAQIIEESTQEVLALHSSAVKMAEVVPIIRMVNTIIERALMQNASDIHLQPTSHDVVVRFRIDGILYTMVELPREILPPLVARLKIISNLKIDQHQKPQDSRFSYSFNEREVSIRVSVIPTLHGSKVVLRLLDMEQNKFTLRRLGLNKRDFDLVRKAAKEPHGMILVTGPTGSGKTTTLYTLLHLLNREDVNICTVEDPIEYGIDGVNQTQINPSAGLTFATGLKSLLRQDPNILMVGEIRDEETADMAVNAAMTGHMVLSTLHTNNAFLTPERLLEMGVPGYLVGSVVNLIISQRLVRKVCPDCKVKSRSQQKIIENYSELFKMPKAFDKLKKYGLLPKGYEKLEDVVFYYGRGCMKCNQSGYRGRIGIYEILLVDEKIRKLIAAGGASADQVKAAAIKQGALTISEEGVLKVLQGRTTFDEVIRILKD